MFGDMGTKDWLNLGSSLLNGYLGSKAAGKASDQQLAAMREANALQKYMYDQQRNDNMPALQARNNGLSGYQNLLKDPSKITSDPGYQFGLDQGTEAIGSQAAANGSYYSGATLKALNKYGQDYGHTKFDQSLDRYGRLAGLGSSGAAMIGQAGQNYGNQVGQNLIGGGNARGAATLAQYGSWQNALNQYQGYRNYQDWTQGMGG
jgi:type II secretory pathway pseudopilin PulG